MEDPTLDEVIKSSKVIVHRGRYAYLKAQETAINNHFFISKDKDEITIVTEEENVPNVKYDKDVKWFKLIEIKVSVPFLQGFIAKVTNFIAANGCNTLVVSTFSKDYILTKEEQVERAVSALKQAGFSVEFEK